jgi:hypothetical protein
MAIEIPIPATNRASISSVRLTELEARRAIQARPVACSARPTTISGLRPIGSDKAPASGAGVCSAGWVCSRLERSADVLPGVGSDALDGHAADLIFARARERLLRACLYLGRAEGRRAHLLLELRTYAAAWYSWMSPPRRSRRWRRSGAFSGVGSRPLGGRRSSARCA